MSRDDILTEVFNSGILTKLANKYIMKLGSNADEFVSHCLAIICEIPEDRLIKLYDTGQLYFYVVSIAKNQCWSDKSTFNKNVLESGIIKVQIGRDAKESEEEFYD